jgi:SAM-dependent methyltransferase
VDRFDFFSRLPRSEPGGTTFTSAYLSFVQIQRSDRVLDLRTGSGERAVWIARSRGCDVVAVDQDHRFCRLARARAAEGGAHDHVSTICARYGALPFQDEAFTLIVAEWAPISLGLNASLKLWRRLIPVGGHIAISYPGIVNKDAPQEVRGPLELRMAEPMAVLSDYQTIIRALGYEIIYQAPLAQALWENFYTDATRRAWALNNQEAASKIGIVRTVLDEARWYRHVGRGRVFLQSILLRRTR